MCLVAVVAVHNASASSMMLKIFLNDGSNVSYQLSDLPVLVMHDTSLEVKSDQLSSSFQWSDIANMLYVSETDNVKTLSLDTCGQIVFGDSGLFVEASVDTQIVVSDLHGKVFLMKYLKSGEQFLMEFSTLVSGVYIVTVNNHSYKFIVK